MAKCDRTGKRKTRGQKNAKKYDLGYYLVFTDTHATEKYYFEGLYDKLPEEIKNKLRVEVVSDIKTWKLVEVCQNILNKDSQYRKGWIVFDRDKVVNFDNIIYKANSQDINVGWSNPCFEIWLYAYYGKTPEFKESTDCCTNFGRIYKEKTGKEYSKSDENLYSIMTTSGNEEKAINHTKKRYEDFRKCRIVKPSEMTSCSTVFQLVQEIREKVKK